MPFAIPKTNNKIINIAIETTKVLGINLGLKDFLISSNKIVNV